MFSNVIVLNETLSNTRRVDKNVNIKRKQMIVQNGCFNQNNICTLMLRIYSKILVRLNYLKNSIESNFS